MIYIYTHELLDELWCCISTSYNTFTIMNVTIRSEKNHLLYRRNSGHISFKRQQIDELASMRSVHENAFVIPHDAYFLVEDNLENY